MVYVHIPFCGSFCTYCGFYSETVCPGADFKDFTQEICAEIESRKDEIAATAPVDTLYIGGGTPSLIPLESLSRIAEAVMKALSPCGKKHSFREFTVEVNPEDIVTRGEEYVRGLLDIGVNRVSMGVQSLDDGILRWMNRRHDVSGALSAYDILRKAGVRNISIDIIYGISHLSDAVLLDTVNGIVALRPEHISAYQLGIDEDSILWSMVSDGRYGEASDEQCRHQYSLVCSALRDAGYEHYEISNWAMPGFRAVHNSAYWTRAPYVGIGPGAHSFSILPPSDVAGASCRTEQRRSWNSSSLTGWERSSEVLSPEEIREEEVMLGLRTLEGWDGRQLSEEEWFVSDDIISDILARS